MSAPAVSYLRLCGSVARRLADGSWDYLTSAVSDQPGKSRCPACGVVVAFACPVLDDGRSGFAMAHPIPVCRWFALEVDDDEDDAPPPLPWAHWPKVET